MDRDQSEAGSERPSRIGGVAVVERVESARHGVIVLPNGKRVIGFLGDRDSQQGVGLRPGARVVIEMNPYDMSRARIVAEASDHPG